MNLAPSSDILNSLLHEHPKQLPKTAGGGEIIASCCLTFPPNLSTFSAQHNLSTFPSRQFSKELPRFAVPLTHHHHEPDQALLLGHRTTLSSFQAASHVTASPGMAILCWGALFSSTNVMNKGRVVEFGQCNGSRRVLRHQGQYLQGIEYCWKSKHGSVSHMIALEQLVSRGGVRGYFWNRFLFSGILTMYSGFERQYVKWKTDSLRDGHTVCVMTSIKKHL